MLYTASSNIVPWKTEREAEGKLGVGGGGGVGVERTAHVSTSQRH